MREVRNEYNILVRKRERKRPLKELGVNGRIILEKIFTEWKSAGRLDCVAQEKK
jgi:hypothetical protein